MGEDLWETVALPEKKGENKFKGILLKAKRSPAERGEGD